MSSHAKPDQLPAEAPGDVSPAASTSRRMLFIVNPHATTVSEELRDLVLYALRGRYEVEAIDTEAPGHATELCREAAHEGYDVVVTFGGDGTVNEAANGLRGSATPLFCLPGGSANVLARLLGIPADIIDATERLLARADDWRPRTIDLGSVNGRCFTFSSGVGLDASVVKRVDSNPHLKARLGAYYFTWVAIATFVRRYLLRSPTMEVRVGGHRYPAITTVVQNGATFTYFNDHPIAIADDGELDSGALAGAALRRATPLNLPSILWSILSPGARITRQRQVRGFSGTTELTVGAFAGRALPLQVDGDYVGDVAEARYTILPRSLSVLA